MPSSSESNETNRLRMNLRLWSDDVDFSNLPSALGIKCDIQHKKGETILDKNGNKTSRIVKKNYISFEETCSFNMSDIPLFVQKNLDKIKQNNALREQINSHKIEAVCWIALMGSKSSLEFSPIAEEIVDQAKKMGLKIFLENYTKFDEEGAPLKIWLS